MAVEEPGGCLPNPEVDPDLLVGRGGGTTRPWPGWDVLAAVSVGGALGATARYGVTLAVPTTAQGWPWATFIANVGGSLGLGALTALAVARYPLHPLVRPLLGVGVLGSFTTYSTFVVEIDTRLGQGQMAMAVVYALGSVVAGVGAAAAGLGMGRRLAGEGPCTAR
ncbi:MAG: CrcB family protein [Microthrixaceae bacterium]